MQSALEEILRYRAALAVQAELERLCKAHLPASPSSDARGLLPSAIFEGHQSLATTAVHPSDVRHRERVQQTREWVHPILDVRRQADVVEVSRTATTAATRLRLVAMQYVQGDILGVVVPAELTADAGAETCAQSSTRCVSVKKLRLATPEPFYHDALLPALEAIEPHHASKNLLDLWLTKLCGAANKMDTSFNRKRKAAWQMADEATYIFYAVRKQLAERIGTVRMHNGQDGGERPWKLKVHLQSGDVHLLAALSSVAESTRGSGRSAETAVVIDLVGRAVDCSEWVSLREWLTLSAPSHGEPLASHEQLGVEWTVLSDAALRLRIPIRPAVVLRLHTRYIARQRAETSAAADSFPHALARLLLRYHGLCGGRMEKESGWQAAVPPPVMDAFEHHHQGSLSPQRPTVVVECFASPFNATRPFFFSVFHDTDAVFGSLGNFFACCDVAACVAAADAAVGPSCGVARAREESSAPCASGGAVATVSLASQPHRLLRLECNPPFVHEVIAAAFAHLLRWLEGASSTTAVSILIIVPDSGQAHAAKVRATIEESRFCRWVRSLPPPDCLYVHGANHQDHSGSGESSLHLGGRKRPRDTSSAATAPSWIAVHAGSLVRLSCPTRLMIIQDDEAEHACTGATIGAEVCAAWSRLSHAVSSAVR
ncbi:Phosphorylated CTD interacting factor 1 WW domain containing protein [Leishmania donovani]|uniref:Phosphorylated CTD interacting factor 1 WW domain family protein n=1 Tax=Leishmania donovani TaxID=5661 RepID=A0A504XL51_LEIDO|nr:Phosphorylated CTD interacting factor 1 WW domain family protein [Leishmania donovani]CAJ1993951.1 Phosphorylated CTD interacting factor 1 WW domain containing protein [Leishmania donovani]VDZ49772.1 Phosphorylated_CTD_interacting_factor_1_WW_domain_containing_protein_putative/Pfam:PF12237 [Leishmania donovani]